MFEGEKMKKFSFVLTLCFLLFFELSIGEEKIQSDDYELEVTDYDYGQIMIGHTAQSDNYITNVGTRIFTIYGFEILGYDSLCFQLPENISLPYMLETGGSCVVHFSFTPTEAKAYKVIVNVKYDGLEQAALELHGNGIISDIEVGKSRNEVIAPNPATDYIEINFPPLVRGLGDVARVVSVYNLLGVEVLKTTTPSLGDTPPYQGGESIRIDISGLSPGVYFVLVGDIVQKFVKM